MTSARSLGPMDTGARLRPAREAEYPREVLERRDHPGRLEPPHVRGADHADEVRVLPDGLLDPAPPRVADDVEHGREPLVDPHRAHVLADAARHPLDETRVERGPPRDGDGVGRRAPGGESGEALLVGHRRDAVRRLLEDLLLGAREGERAERGVHRRRAEGPGQLTQAPGQQHPEVQFDGEVVLVGGDVSAVGVRAHPDPVELGDLLLEGHRRHEGVEGEGCSVRGHSSQPFTAPVSPPTMRRCASVKKRSAGIMATEVNASTPAVSCE
jgi:hypothetical protein